MQIRSKEGKNLPVVHYFDPKAHDRQGNGTITESGVYSFMLIVHINRRLICDCKGYFSQRRKATYI